MSSRGLADNMNAERTPGMHATVDRSHLVDRIHRSKPGRITLIIAPAGYGKTTLADQWSRTARHPVASLSVSPLRDSAEGILTGVLDALARVTTTPIGLPSHTPRVGSVLAAMEAIVGESGALTVILDDFEDVSAPETLAAVDALIAGMPSGAHLMVLSRSTPRLTLARLRARGRLGKLTAADLRFTLDEAMAVLDGVSLAPHKVRRVVDRTEGWITGIRQVRDALDQAGRDVSIDNLIDALARDHWLTTYFREEVLDRLPATLRETVLLTSAFPILDPELCAATLGLDHPEDMLQELVLRGVFVSRIEPFGSSLRYHHMFAEAAVGIARRELGSARLREVWGSGAAWLAGQGRFGDALKLAVRARDWELATRCAVRFVHNPEDQDHVDIVKKKLDLLPRDILMGTDALAYAYIQACSYAGSLRSATSVADVMLPRWSTSDDPELRGYGASTIGHRHVLDGDDQVALDHLYEALRLTPDDRVLDRLHSWTAVSHLEFLRNNPEAAEHAYREAARCRARLGRSPYMWEMYTRPDRANQLAMQGDLHAAEEMYRDQYQRSAEVHQTPMSKPLALLGAIYLEWREHDLALEAITRMGDDQETFPYDVWRPEGLNLMAQVYLACGMLEDAERSLRASVAMLQERGGTMHLRRARAIEATLWLRTGKRARAREWAEIEQHKPPLPSRAFRDFDPRLALIDILLDDGRWADAEAVARQGIEASHSPNRNAPRIRFLVWHAVALAMGGELDRSDEALREALEIGMLGTFIATFHPPGHDLSAQLGRIQQTARPEIKAYIDRIVADGQPGAPPAPRGAGPIDTEPGSLPCDLTPREREVLALVQQGAINREIADRLYITERTVKKHIANLCRKLDAPNRTAAVARAYELGLLD